MNGPFTQQEYDAAIRLAKDARAAYKSHAITERELRQKFDTIRYIIHQSPMTYTNMDWLLKTLGEG